MDSPRLIKGREDKKIISNVVPYGGWGISVVWKISSSDSRELKRGRTTLVIIFILFLPLSVLVKSLLTSPGSCDQYPLIPIFPIHKFSECVTGIISLVMGDGVIRDSIPLDILPFSIHKLP